MQCISKKSLTGVILAGGRATRMGGQDKGLMHLCGQPMVTHIIRVLQPQVNQIIINANRNLASYAALGQEQEQLVISDQSSGFFGPLAGMLAGMLNSHSAYILTTPCDSPLLPQYYAQRMCQALSSGKYQLCVAHDGQRLQPVFALLPIQLQADLNAFLDSGERKIDRWFNQYAMAIADFSDNPAMFRNINTTQELARLEAELAQSL